jgi:hypothetical protein
MEIGDEDGDIYPKYRIYAQKSGVATVYSVHETCYDFDDIPLEYSKVPVSLIALSDEDLIKDIEDILDAFEHPIISIENFPEPYEDI